MKTKLSLATMLKYKLLMYVQSITSIKYYFHFEVFLVWVKNQSQCKESGKL